MPKAMRRSMLCFPASLDTAVLKACTRDFSVIQKDPSLIYLGAASSIVIVFRQLCEKSRIAADGTQMATKNPALTVRNIQLCSR